MSKVIVTGHYYVRPKCKKLYDPDEISSYKAKGYVVRNESSDGGLYLAKPCEAWICVELPQGKIYKQDMRNEICVFYHKNHLKLERFNFFVISLLTEAVKLRWAENHLEIIPLEGKGAK